MKAYLSGSIRLKMLLLRSWIESMKTDALCALTHTILMEFRAQACKAADFHHSRGRVFFLTFMHVVGDILPRTVKTCGETGCTEVKQYSPPYILFHRIHCFLLAFFYCFPLKNKHLMSRHPDHFTGSV